MVPFRSKPLLLTALALLVAAALSGILEWHAASARRARLVETIPDLVLEQPDLYRLALRLGRPAFARYCASCHGAGGEPDPLHGVPDLRDHDWLYGSGRVSEIERVVLYGIRSGNSKGWNLASMPAFATPDPYSRYKTAPLAPQAIDAVTEYLYSMQHADADAALAARGKKVFEDQSRGECWDCHGGHGQGDPGIGAPNLSDRIWLYGDGSRNAIRISISYGREGVCPAWIDRLSPVTVRALAVYTQSLSVRPALQARTTIP